MTEPLALPIQNTTLPERQYGDWRIELRQLPILYRGHAYLALVDPSGRAVERLDGLAMSRNTNRIVPMGSDGSRLIGWRSHIDPQDEGTFDPRNKIGEIAVGPYDDVVGGKWARALQAADEINRRNLDYKADDLSNELVGRNGGQIQNSNSALSTFGRAMGVDLDGRLREGGLDRRFPGLGRDVLDPDYTPYVAPPAFPNVNAPLLQPKIGGTSIPAL